MADVGGIASERLQSFVERLERLEEEKAALSEDIKEVYSEAKSGGFDIKINDSLTGRKIKSKSILKVLQQRSK